MSARRATLPVPTKRMLTQEEAAEYCGLSVNSFRAYVTVAPVNFGRCVRFDRNTLDEWLDNLWQSEASNTPVWELVGGTDQDHGRGR